MNLQNYFILFVIIWALSTLIMSFIIKNANEGEADQILTKNWQYIFVGSLLGLVLALTIITFIGKILWTLN